MISLRFKSIETIFCVFYFSYMLSKSYCSMQCFIGQAGTRERKHFSLKICTTPPTVRPISSCLVYRYQTNGNGSQDDSERLIYPGSGNMEFACDARHICNREGSPMNKWINNVTYKGMKSELYCCNTKGCNDPRGFHTPETHIQCYAGRMEQGGFKGEYHTCKSSYCYNMTIGNSTEFGCDMENKCLRNALSGICKDTQLPNRNHRLCCCQKSKCNIPVRKPVNYGSHGSPKKPVTAPVKSMVPMDPNMLPESHRQQQRERSRVAGIVSAVVLGIALVILLTVIAIKQWQKYREKYNFSYMQLTADMMTL